MRDHRASRDDRDAAAAGGASIWTRPEPGARRPRFTREQIAKAAIAIADADGYDAVSMRRVAAELGAGTMTLYHYVRTKEDLVRLMHNEIMGEVVVPDGQLPTQWRPALEVIARSSRNAFLRHPWAFEALKDAQVGPNGMRHFDQTLAAVSGLDLGPRERLEVSGIVDDFVFGFVVRSLEHGEDDEDELHQMLQYVQEMLDGGDYPHIRGFTDELGGDDPARAWVDMMLETDNDERFERGLGAVLDGIESRLERGW